MTATMRGRMVGGVGKDGVWMGWDRWGWGHSRGEGWWVGWGGIGGAGGPADGMKGKD